PEAPRKGDPITVVEAAEALDGVHVLHAGTATDDAGRLVTAGGRVLSVVGTGADVAAAPAAAYAGVAEIAIDGAHHRTDTAARRPAPPHGRRRRPMTAPPPRRPSGGQVVAPRLVTVATVRTGRSPAEA